VKFLSLQIAHFAFAYLRDKLGLQKIEERYRTVEDIGSIRLEYIASNPSTGTHIETHGGIALESDITAGVVRVRPRPYANDTWYGKNSQDAVMMVPGLDVWKGMPEDFDIGNPEHESNFICQGCFILSDQIQVNPDPL
jgi:hypothetical protein